MSEYVLFDLDGTLSIVDSRLRFLNETPKNWDAFYQACNEDKPNQPIINLYNVLYDFYYIKIITGRLETVRDKTLDWLRRHEVECYTEDLIMRPDKDFRHDTILKPELAAPFLDNAVFAVDDRNSMVKKWREIGIPCLQVADGDF